MEGALHRFVRLLRLRGVRISIPEALDAMACARQPGMLRDRETLRAALRVALVKDRRDEEIFDEIFDQFFALVKVGGPDVGHGHGHGHDDLSDEGALTDFTLSEEPSETPQQGHSHGKPADIRDYFDPDDLAQQYNLHQEANKIDLAAMTDEIVLSKDNQGISGEGNRVQIETDRLHHAGAPGQISQAQGTKVDADLSVAQQDALLGWLNEVDRSRRRAPRTTPPRCAGGSPGCWPGCPRRSSATWRRCWRWSSGWWRATTGRSPRWTGSASTSGWSWRSRSAGWPARCTAG